MQWNLFILLLLIGAVLFFHYGATKINNYAKAIKNQQTNLHNESRILRLIINRNVMKDIQNENSVESEHKSKIYHILLN
jgi:hypothetical protein